MYNELALFSCIAGLSLGLERSGICKTVCHVERADFAAASLAKAMARGELTPAPIWSDIRTFDGKPWRGIVELISGGFPCQDVSKAGKKAGLKEGNRTGLWFEYARIIDEIRPRIVVIENVPGLIGNGLDIVLADLRRLRYFTLRPILLEAASVGGLHHRERIFIVAYAMQLGCLDGEPEEHAVDRKQAQHASMPSTSTYTDEQGLEGEGSSWPVGNTPASLARQWAVEPDVVRMVHGVPYRVDRIHCLGNAVVPAVAEIIGGAIMAMERSYNSGSANVGGVR